MPIINGAPTPKNSNHDLTAVQRHKRQILPNDVAIDLFETNDYSSQPETEVVFEGLLGCKYDINVCNQNEACFDDGLFGQCWNGEGSERSAFTLKTGVDGLTDDKIIATEYTLEFLNRYHLSWRDYMTQCILSHIFSTSHQVNPIRLETFYEDCLKKDQYLDELAEYQEEKLNRRQVEYYNSYRNFNYRYPNIPFLKSDSVLINFERPNQLEIMPVSAAYIQAFEKDREEAQAQAEEALGLISANRPDAYYIDNDEIEIEPVSKNFIPSESIMNEPVKVAVHTNEGYPGLLETLQINNNKQLLPVVTEQEMSPHLNEKTDEIKSNKEGPRYFAVETARGYIIIDRDFKDQFEGAHLLSYLAQINSWPAAIFTELNTDHHLLTFHVLDNAYRINASNVATSALDNQKQIENQLGIRITDSGIGNPRRGSQLSVENAHSSRLTIITLVICALVLFTMAAFALLYFIKRNDRIRNKLAEITHIKGLSTNYYQDLCRQRMQTQPSGNKSPDVHKTQQTPPSSAGPTTTSASAHTKHNSEGSSTRSSTSSWSEEPVAPVNMDIMTGHLILSYMEDHLRDRHRLEAEWQALCTDEANEERASSLIAISEANANKNRYIDCIPYDHARIRLVNNADGDYINASTITDSDPKCKYIATQGPMPNTTNAFWQMVWEQGSCVIVALTRPIENGITMCHHYWPVEGSARFNDFEVNLVSEHIWSDDYLVRSFYLKNVQTMETRTVTQFHFLTWGETNNPPSAKALLDFRRKVNKCFRGRSSPIIVHCNDGIGRTGTYILLDIVLNRICKGAREINIAATLEHIRDQRAKMVKTKEQFEFVFVAVAEEVTYLLKALPQ